MCRLWGRIRYGVRWDPVDQAQLALKSFSLKDVTAVFIQFDPLHGDSKSLRFLSFVTHKSIDGKRQSELIAAKMNRRWICGDVWMDILPSFDRPQLGLKMALLSDRFDVLVDTHFDGKSEFKIWNTISIEKGPEAELCVLNLTNFKSAKFSLPDRPLPNKIRFRFLRIDYVDHAVLAFLHANKPIWDRWGTELRLWMPYPHNKTAADVQPIWDVLTSEIWPIFTTTIRHLCIGIDYNLDNLRRLISPTILTDLDQLDSIDSDFMCPAAGHCDDDGPNATAAQALAKWLHTPSKNGQPKRLFCENSIGSNFQWITSFKEKFICARNSSVSYKIRFGVFVEIASIEAPFELVNEWTKEKLTLKKDGAYYWLLKRCPISETAPVKWENDGNLDNKKSNFVHFCFTGGNNCIGPMSPP
ncbi:hypothetical protein niasHS_015622 [Heterodera schachtii]|uniref:Uncharacterized protein n=1 Tax=Heterodera schachtii TaxID=97005 RepID=A0ABD2HWK5_HETSC